MTPIRGHSNPFPHVRRLAALGGAWITLVCTHTVSAQAVNAQAVNAQAVNTRTVNGQSVNTQTVNEDQQLSLYLERLGLIDLRTMLLESQLAASGLTGPGRADQARRLADLYSQQLIENLDQKERYDDLSRRVSRLLADHPDARTAALEVLLLQADYQRAEKLIGQWMVGANQDAPRDEAREIIGRITPVLDARQEQLWLEVERMIAESDTRESPNEEVDRALMRQRTISARASYFAAWSLYYQSLLIPAQSTDGVRRARAIFRRLLEISDTDKLSEFDGEQLGLESPWRARTLIGLGLCEAALGDLPASRDCFKLLAGDTTPRDLRDQSDYWYAQGLLNAGQRGAAIEFARRIVPAFTPEPTQGKVSLCAVLVRAAYSDPATRQSPESRQLAQLGVGGLARMRQHRVLREMLTTYGISIDDPRGFLLLWLRGQQLRELADRTGKPDDYQRAAEALKAALADPEAASDLGGAGHCRAEWAWCLYQSGKLKEAGAEYVRAAESLRAANDPGAVEAGWMAFAAAHRLWQQDARSVQTVRDAADWLTREFPKHDHTRRAEFMVMKMSLRSASVEQQIQSLRAVPASDPNYLAARQDLCRILLDAWRTAAPDQKTAQGTAVRQASEELLAAAGSRLEPDQQLRLRLMAIEVAALEQDWSAARHQLDSAASINALDEELLTEFHYRGLQVARGEDSPNAAQPHIDWFLDHASGTRFEAAGLVIAAKFIESSAGPETPLDAVAASKVYRIYQRLAQAWGDAPDVLKSNRNALVATTKVMSYGQRLGHLDEANAACQRLLAAFPQDRNFLHSAAQLAFASRNYRESLERWRTILAGTRVGVSEWYEAKYYQILCLIEVDRPSAKRVFEQFRLLDPNFGPPEWREKFQEIERKLP